MGSVGRVRAQPLLHARLVPVGVRHVRLSRCARGAVVSATHSAVHSAVACVGTIAARCRPPVDDVARRPCADRDASCRLWAMYGHCTTSRRFMMTACARTCRCCQ